MRQIYWSIFSAAGLAAYDTVVALVREGLRRAEARERLDAEGVPYHLLEALQPMFEDDRIWSFVAAVLDYDPAPALARIEVPVLGLFGSDDEVTPTEESVAALRAAVRPDLLQIEVFRGGDHRLQEGDPPRFVAGCLDRLAAFVS